MSDKSFDLVVIGAGPGGYVAAIRAAQLGLSVACIERENLGGICLNWGCIPTKALLRSAEIYHQMERAKDYGLSADKIGFDLDAIVQRSRGVAKQMNGGIKGLFKKNKITSIMGEAKLAGKGQVIVITDKGTETLTGKNIIVATGARARELPGLEADGDLVWAYRQALACGRQRHLHLCEKAIRQARHEKQKKNHGQKARPLCGQSCGAFGRRQRHNNARI